MKLDGGVIIFAFNGTWKFYIRDTIFLLEIALEKIWDNLIFFLVKNLVHNVEILIKNLSLAQKSIF